MIKTTKLRRKANADAADAPAPDASQVEQASAPSPVAKGKIGALVALLNRTEGATIADMMAATGWQAHSVRGALAGSIKKKLKLAVSSEKKADGRVYRIVLGAV